MSKIEKTEQNPFSQPVARVSAENTKSAHLQDASAYAASIEKRFHISSDEMSRQRIKVLHECFKKIKKTLPNVSVALVLGGSLSKGKTLTSENGSESDIDAWIVIDNDELLIEHSDLIKNNQEYAHAQGRFTTTENILKNAHEYLKQLFIKTLNENKKEMGFNQDEKTLDGSFDYVIGISKQGSGSILDAIGNLEYYKSPEAQTKNWGNFVFSSSEALGKKIKAAELRIAIFFLLDIGGGLKKHRQLFLQELASHGLEFAELKWRIVRNAILVFEREKHHGQEIPTVVQNLYPETFLEACKYYQTKLTAN